MQLTTRPGEAMSKRKLYSAIDAAAMRRRKRAHLPVGRRELCEYVMDFALEFHEVAISNDMKFLSYLLAMVVEEAVHQSEIAADSESAPADDTSPPDATDS
jgi:hypothetical protein